MITWKIGIVNPEDFLCMSKLGWGENQTIVMHTLGVLLYKYKNYRFFTDITKPAGFEFINCI
jgi:hypothetical protein